MSNILFEVGDWSGDGHSFSAEFLVKSNKTLQEVREIHFKENEFFGTLCADFGQTTVSIFELFSVLTNHMSSNNALAVIKTLAQNPELEVWDKNEDWVEDVNKLSVDEEDEHVFNVCSALGLLQIWIAVLQGIDSTLTLSIESNAMSRYYVKYKGYPAEPDGSIHFYGLDNQGRHLKTPGYGVWTTEESSEFCSGN